MIAQPHSARIEAQGLSHQFPDGVWGLKEVTLAFDSGQFTVVAGANGAGKTLLMRHLVGLAAPTTGLISWNGVEISRCLNEVRRGVGLVFQDSNAQIVSLTVEEEVAFGPRNYGWSSAEVESAVKGALAVVGLESRRSEICAHLSGGERRRLAIAGVLACGSEILILDEPFTGLDLPSVRAVLRALTELRAKGAGIVLLTHELDKCLALADRLVLMAEGRVLADGSPVALWDQIPLAQAHRPMGTPQRLREMSWL